MRSPHQLLHRLLAKYGVALHEYSQQAGAWQYTRPLTAILSSPHRAGRYIEPWELGPVGSQLDHREYNILTDTALSKTKRYKMPEQETWVELTGPSTQDPLTKLWMTTVQTRPDLDAQ